MPKFSIIVPVYNAEKYLNDCIKSVLNQTVSDFELILVDDGSPDNCGKICDEYAKQDNRIKVIHKPNGGVAAARNDALNIAAGEFISFVDSDDWISENYLEELASLNCDINMCEFTQCLENGTFYGEEVQRSINTNVTKEYLLQLLEKQKIFTVCNAIFRKNLIEQAGNLRFRTDMSYGEDSVFILTLLKKCKSMAFSDKAKYYYNRHGDDTLSRAVTEKSVYSYFEFEKFCEKWLEEMNITSEFFESSGFSSKRRLRLSFYKIFEDGQMPKKEKIRWYGLFVKNRIFTKNIDVMFPDMSKSLKTVLKLRSPRILLLYQNISSRKNRK